jgi:hypothetical protein
MLRHGDEYLVIDAHKGKQIYIGTMCAVRDYKIACRITKALNTDEENE